MPPFISNNLNPRNSKISIVFWLILASLLVHASSFNASDTEMQQWLYDFAFFPIRDFHFSFNFILHSLTYQFIHHNLRHLLFNMLALWIFGKFIEQAFGRMRFLGFYLTGGIFAVIAQTLMGEAHYHNYIIGASGSIAAVMAAYLLLFGRTQLWILLIIIPIKLPAFVFILIWACVNIYGLIADHNTSIAIWAHLGGFAFGLIATFFLKPKNMRFLQKLSP